MHVDIWSLYRVDREAANETNDCTVLSLACLFGWTYGKARAAMRVAGGRQDRKSASMHVAASMIPGLVELGHPTPEETLSLAQFCRVHRRGRYWVNVTGHALAVIDGKIHDHSYSPRRRVRYAWRVEGEA